jgi:hypothetical protein
MGCAGNSALRRAEIGVVMSLLQLRFAKHPLTPVRRKCVRLYFSVLLRFQPQRHISQPSLS